MRKLVMRAVEAAAPELAYALREQLHRASTRRADDRSPRAIFSEIYRDGAWGGGQGEYYSGTGSDDEVSGAYVAVARDYIERHGIRSVVDLGCGDFRVGGKLLSPGLAYTGVDVVPDLIEANRREHGALGVRFETVDIIHDELPDGELYLLRQVLQHLSNDHIAKVLDKLRAKSHVLLAEHHPAPRRFKRWNQDKPTGKGTRVVFGSGVHPQEPPFSFPCRVIATTDVPPLISPGETISIFAKTPEPIA